ncbi:MAG: GIY-YIG nuclease family protein [Thermomicrobiales bacterium]
MSARSYYVYIMSSVSRTLYIGVTNNLERRVAEHRLKLNDGFARRYNTTMLVFAEEFPNPADAIAREKQLKKWNRSKKLWLIEKHNPEWRDIAHEWFQNSTAAFEGSPNDDRGEEGALS